MSEEITDQELADLERVGGNMLRRYGAELHEDLPETRLTLRLIGEIRRLRRALCPSCGSEYKQAPTRCHIHSYRNGL